jgi:hypothetical protein
LAYATPVPTSSADVMAMMRGMRVILGISC